MTSEDLIGTVASYTPDPSDFLHPRRPTWGGVVLCGTKSPAKAAVGLTATMRWPSDPDPWTCGPRRLREFQPELGSPSWRGEGLAIESRLAGLWVASPACRRDAERPVSRQQLERGDVLGADDAEVAPVDGGDLGDVQALGGCDD
jgi:hypothetical protein